MERTIMSPPKAAGNPVVLQVQEAVQNKDVAEANAKFIELLKIAGGDFRSILECTSALIAGGMLSLENAALLEESPAAAMPEQARLNLFAQLRKFHGMAGRKPQAQVLLMKMAALPIAPPGVLYDAAREALQANRLEQAVGFAQRMAQQNSRLKEAQQIAMACAVRNPTLEAAFELVNQLCPSGSDEASTLVFYEKLQKKFPNAPIPQRYALALLTKVSQSIQLESPQQAAPSGSQAGNQQLLRQAIAANDPAKVIALAFPLYEESQDSQYLEAVSRFAGGLGPQEAVAAYEKLVALDPDKGPWLISLARQQVRANDFQGALQTVIRYQDLPFAQVNLVASVLMIAFDKATDAYEKDILPFKEEAYLGILSLMHQSLSHLHGQEPELSVKVAEKLLEREKFPEADELFRAANEHPAMRTRALIGECKALLGMGQHRQAEGVALRALDELRNEDKNLLWLAAIAAKDTDPRHAILALERFLAAHPEAKAPGPTAEEAAALIDELKKNSRARRATGPSILYAPEREQETGDTEAPKPEETPAPQAKKPAAGEEDAAAFFARMRENYAKPEPAAVAPEDVHKPKTEGESAKEKLFARYKTERTLGKGGMGTVYMAADSLLDRIVAIKIITSSGLTTKDTIDRMAREAKAIAKLSHPNVIYVYDVGLFEDFKYLVMEYVDGLSLKQLIKRKGAGLPLQSTKHIALQVADALYHAHERAIVHRDVKPDNVLVSRTGEVKVMDFGLAKFVDNTEQTIDGITAGTLQYMAPEQFSGKNLDHRADVYAFGCMLYEMLTSEPPFEGNELTKMMYRHLHDPPPPLPESVGPKREALEKLIHHCMAKKPQDRPANMQEVRLALEKIN